MSEAQANTSSTPISWGDVLSPIGKGLGTAAGGYLGGFIGRAIGNQPSSFGQGVLFSSIDDQIDAIKNLTQDLEDRAAFYRNLSQQATKQLGKTSGATLPNYREKALERFNKGVARERGAGIEYLTNYDPNVLASPAAQRMQQALASATGGFAAGLGDLSTLGSQRFAGAAIQAPIESFKAIANDRDYNMLLNPTYMSQATQPETISMDLNKYNPYMTYNV